MKSKHLARALALLCCFAVIFSLSFTAFATSTPEKTSSTRIIQSDSRVSLIQNTTDLTPNEYAMSRSSISASQNTDLALQSTCELFIASIFAGRRDESYDFTIFSAKRSAMDDTLAYIESMNEYQRTINELMDFNIVSDNITFGSFSATITGNTCTAEIPVHYSYELTGAFNETCYLNTVYYLTLEKVDNMWNVISAKSGMEMESGEDFVYGAFDAQAAANAVATDISFAAAEPYSDVFPETNVQQTQTRAAYTRTPYDRNDAVAYAVQYFDTTNSLFGASSENCQNFASQCVWAGLLDGVGASGTSRTAFPAVSWSWLDESEPNVWCRNQNSTYYDHYSNNWAWDNVNGFIRLIWASDHTQSGPQGYYWYGLAKADVGDVIVWDTAGTRDVTTGDYDHAMFVTKVTGTEGSRGVSDLFIAANTTQTESAYMPLAQYCSYSTSCFCTLDITDGYYYI